MNDAAIDLRHVVVSAGECAILDAINLKVAAAERIALIGPNGAGKSTLLKLLTGIVKPSHGEVNVLDWNASKPLSKSELRRLRALVGHIFQGLHLVHRLTVLENVLLGSLSRNRSWLTWARIFPPDEVKRAEALLESVGLIGKAHTRADRLSGGERQKAAIARMLMQRPRLILADEPTAALDPVASADIANRLSTLAREQGITLVTVVHDPGLLPLLADRVIGLRQGRIAFDLPMAEVSDDILNKLYRNSAAQGWMARFDHTSVLAGENA
jgi:phosphonate transport system ATP-binding protein